jgi:hypothetical protein
MGYVSWSEAAWLSTTGGLLFRLAGVACWLVWLRYVP